MSDADQAVVRGRLDAVGIAVRETYVDGYAVKRSSTNMHGEE
jgi:hypothetical protein